MYSCPKNINRHVYSNRRRKIIYRSAQLVFLLFSLLVSCKEIKKPALIDDKFFTIPIETSKNEKLEKLHTNMLITDNEIIYSTKDTIDDISMIGFNLFIGLHNTTNFIKYKDTSFYQFIPGYSWKGKSDPLVNDSLLKTLNASSEYIIYLKNIGEKTFCSFVFWNVVSFYNHESPAKAKIRSYPDLPCYIRNINEYTPNVVTNLDSVTIHRLFPQFKGKIINSDYVKSIYMDPRYYYGHKNFFLSIEFRLINGDTLKYREIPNLKIDEDDGLKKPYLIL